MKDTTIIPESPPASTPFPPSAIFGLGEFPAESHPLLDEALSLYHDCVIQTQISESTPLREELSKRNLAAARAALFAAVDAACAINVSEATAALEANASRNRAVTTAYRTGGMSEGAAKEWAAKFIGGSELDEVFCWTVENLTNGAIYSCPICEWLNWSGHSCIACGQVESIINKCGAEHIYSPLLNHPPRFQGAYFEQAMSGKPSPEGAIAAMHYSRAQSMADGDLLANEYVCDRTRMFGMRDLYDWREQVRKDGAA